MKNSYIKYIAAAIVALIIGGGIGYAIHGSSSSSDGMSGMTMPSTSNLDSSINTVSKRASATAHTAQDVMFAQMMISHHQQALVMAKLADSHAQSADVKALATTIEAAQTPEINTMTGWLHNWGKSINTDTSMGSMNGEMSQADMDKLTASSGTDFDRMFLQMMTGHHNGAVTMANDELSKGQYADALGLASSIAITQQAQVAQMQQLLKQQ